MCKQCGCDKNAKGSTPETLTGKPTKSPYGEYEGVGGSK